MAISTGNGNLIEGGYPLVKTGTISEENKQAPYLGWAWPPMDWTGRTDNIAAIVFTWAMQAVRAAGLTVAAWAVFFLIKRRITAKKAAKQPGGAINHSGSEGRA